MGDTGRVNLAQKLLDPGGYVWDQSDPLPKTPDYMGATQRQGWSTRPNQSNPFASSSWTQDPTTGQYTQNVTFNPELQSALSRLQGQIGNQGPLPTGEEARNQAIESAYGQAMSRLRPEWDKRQEQTRSQLAAQGLDPTTEAARAQMDTFGRARNDAETSAMASAIQQGTEAGNAIFQQGLASQQLPFQQLGQLRSLTGGFASGDQADPYAASTAAQYLAQMEGYGAKQAGKNSKMQGATAGAGALASMFSDERLKSDITRYSVEAYPGVPLASWTWTNAPETGRHFGVIAQDMQKVAPEHVHEHPSGFLMVDYSVLSRTDHD